MRVAASYFFIIVPPLKWLAGPLSWGHSICFRVFSWPSEAAMHMIAPCSPCVFIRPADAPFCRVFGHTGIPMARTADKAKLTYYFGPKAGARGSHEPMVSLSSPFSPQEPSCPPAARTQATARSLARPHLHNNLRNVILAISPCFPCRWHPPGC